MSVRARLVRLEIALRGRAGAGLLTDAELLRRGRETMRIGFAPRATPEQRHRAERLRELLARARARQEALECGRVP
jgi:hypothetical protein